MNEERKSNIGNALRIGALVLAIVLLWQVVIPTAAQMINEHKRNAAASAQTATLPQGTAEAEEAYRLANEAIEAEDYDTALTRLDEAIQAIYAAETQSSNTALLAELWLKTASLQILKDEPNEALTSLNTALEYNSDEENALLLRAQLYIENGDSINAIADLTAYTEIIENDTTYRQTLAELLEQEGDYKGAAEQYGALDALSDDDGAFILNKARCLFLYGDYEGAIAGFDEYKARIAENEADPYGGIADFLRAACYMQTEDYENAADGFELALELGFDKASCLEQAVLCRFETGEYESVILLGEELSALEDTSSVSMELIYQQMGIAAMRLEENERALEYLSRAEELDGALEGNDYFMGLCLLSLGRTEEAAQSFTESILSGYLQQYCYYNRGVCYVDMLEYDKAAEDMRMTVEAGDDEELVAAAQDILEQLEKHSE